MPWLRYLLYFIAIGLISWALMQMEVASPGSLKLHVVLDEPGRIGSSEFSPLEIIQAIILAACTVIMWWVSQHCPTQEPIALPFTGIAAACLIRELSDFLDHYIVDNLWQVLVAIIGSLLIVFTYRNRRRLNIALARIWPSPGLTLLFAGAVILFAFVQFVGYEPLWVSLLATDYRPVIKIAVEEFIELSGYLLWMIGTIEYAFQARAIAMAEPQPAARRLRQKRRHDAQGKY